MNAYRQLMRRKLLEEVYDRLSEEDKKTFVQTTIQEKSMEEIAQALQRQEAKIDDVSRRVGRYPFASDLLANVGGNFITDGLVWLGKSLLKKY